MLDCAHQTPLAVQRQCRPRTSGVENLNGDPRRQRQILQTNADLGQTLATLESFAVFGTRALNRDSNVNTAVFEQSFDDREVAAHSSQYDRVVVQQSVDDRKVTFCSSHSNGVVVAGRRIDAQQSFDHRHPPGDRS
jgi:hypothetical protein